MVDEVVCLIKGLADIFKDQQTASKDAYSKSQQQIQDLSAAAQILSNTVGTRFHKLFPSPTAINIAGVHRTGKSQLVCRAVNKCSGLFRCFGQILVHLPQTAMSQGCVGFFHIICHYETTHASKLNEKDPMMSIWSFMTSASPISLHNGMFQRNSKFASFFQCIIP